MSAEADIQIATLWGAKGVTAEHVYIVGLCEEAIPGDRRDEYPGTEEEYFEEQRRLFYVSLTRSKKTLVLSRPTKISIGEAKKLSLKVKEGIGFVAGLEMCPFIRDIKSCLPRARQGETMPVHIFEPVKTTAALASAAEKVAETLAEKIAEGVKEKFLDSGFDVEDEWSGEVSDVTVCELDLDDPTVEELNGNVATLQFSGTIEFTAELMIDDPDKIGYDSETGETFAFGHLQRSICSSEYIEGNIEVAINAEDLSRSKILSIFLFGSSYSVPFPWPAYS